MSEQKKLNLKRFKNSADGIVQFARMLEQAMPDRRNTIITRVREEDPEFLDEVMRKVVFFEEFEFLDEGILAEVLGVTPAKVIAHALYNMPEEFKKKMVGAMGFRTYKAVQDEEEKFGTRDITPLALGARRHILKVCRKLEAEEKFVFELDDCPRFQKDKADAA